MAAVDDALDQVDHLGDVPGGSRLVGGWQDSHGLIGMGEFALVNVGPLPPALAVGRRLGQDLVVDVRHVADQGHLVAQPEQPAPDHVEGQGGPDVADVGRALHRGPAHVDANLARFDRPEGGHLVTSCVIQTQTSCGQAD